jgi:hypothetical protein
MQLQPIKRLAKVGQTELCQAFFIFSSSVIGLTSHQLAFAVSGKLRSFIGWTGQAEVIIFPHLRQAPDVGGNMATACELKMNIKSRYFLIR